MAEKKAKALSEGERQKKVLAFLRERDKGKRAYSAADKLLAELRAGGMKAGDAVPLPGERKGTLTDHFEGEDKVFKTCAISRWDIEVSYD